MYPVCFELKGEIITHPPTVFSAFGPSRGRKDRLKWFQSSDEEILSWKGKHIGEDCCLIANGPSVYDYDLAKIDCVTIGLNRAWKLGKWTYYCMADREQFSEYSEITGKNISTLSPLFSTTAGPKHALRLRALLEKTKKFSFDLVKGVYLNNTITSYGLQLSLWMGFKRIFIVGLDLNGGHFDGSRETPDKSFANQRETFGYIAGILDGMNYPVEVINMNPKSWAYAFPKEHFNKVFN